MDSIRIETGEKRIPITRDGVAQGEIVINPKDTLFMERFYKACGDIAAKMGEYQEQELPDDVDARLTIIKDGNAFMREQIDYAFGAGTSQKAFGDFVSLDFDVYAQFIDAIKPAIEPVRAKKIAQYTKKRVAK